MLFVYLSLKIRGKGKFRVSIVSISYTKLWGENNNNRFCANRVFTVLTLLLKRRTRFRFFYYKSIYTYFVCEKTSGERWIRERCYTRVIHNVYVKKIKRIYGIMRELLFNERPHGFDYFGTRLSYDGLNLRFFIVGLFSTRMSKKQNFSFVYTQPSYSAIYERFSCHKLHIVPQTSSAASYREPPRRTL